MRRIAIVTDWFHPRRGGIESQLGELAGRLAAAGNHVRVITGTPGETLNSPFEVRRLDVMTLSSPPLAISPLLHAAIRRELSGHWDAVHAHVSVVSPVGWTGALLARSLGLPVAVTFHSMLRGKAWLLRGLGAVSGLPGARIAWSAVSSAVAGQASWGLHGSEVRVLPNGIDLSAWTVPPRSSGDAVVLVSAMRLHRKKRGRALVRAFADTARAAGGPARLLMVGDGPERRALERAAAQLGLGQGAHRVEFTGWITSARLRDLLSQADGFVMASVHESFGLAALEALAAGVPVVARRSGNSEFLRHGHNALLSDSDQALRADLRAFMADPSLRERLRAGTAELRRFDWPAVVAAHEAEYDRATRLAASAEPVAAPSR